MVAAPAPASSLPTQPSFVVLSPEEKAAGKWSRANMQRAMEILHRDGLLAMTGIVDVEHLEKIRDSMVKTAKEVMPLKKKLSEFNHGIATNSLMSPPLTDPELRFEDVFSNTFVHAIVAGYLGPDFYLSLITANCALPHTSERQAVHKDAPWFHPNAPYGLNTNFMLDDFTASNGSTEFWLGSHCQSTAQEQLFASADAVDPICDVSSEAVAARRKVRPGAQIEVPFGTVTLRDMRTWHAGMPNSTSSNRIMMAVGYTASWFPAPHAPMKAPLSAKPLLTRATSHRLTFIPDDEWDCIAQNWDVDDPEGAIKLPDVPMRGKAPKGEDTWVSLNVYEGEKRVKAQ
ncbi:hypothetical protein JCM1841_003791 [Sporobolomyces salmonicolor]